MARARDREGQIRDGEYEYPGVIIKPLSSITLLVAVSTTKDNVIDERVWLFQRGTPNRQTRERSGHQNLSLFSG